MEWDKKERESEHSYQMFMEYLTCRSFTKIAAGRGISRQAVSEMAIKNQWKERTIAFDKSIMEETRLLIKSKYAKDLARQYENNSAMIEKIQAILNSNDFSKESLKELNKTLRSIFAEQMNIAKFLLDKEEEKDNTLEIRVIDATAEYQLAE